MHPAYGGGGGGGGSLFLMTHSEKGVCASHTTYPMGGVSLHFLHDPSKGRREFVHPG